MKKYLKNYPAVILAVLLLGTVVQAEGEPENLYAQSAVLMDADTGRILFEKNGGEQLPMASTTKIMTLLVTLQNADLDGEVTVSSYAASMPDVQLNIREGERYRLRDLCYSLMLESHNDSASGDCRTCGRQRGRLCFHDESKGAGSGMLSYIFYYSQRTGCQ